MIYKRFLTLFLTAQILLGLWACSSAEWLVQDRKGQILTLRDPIFAPSERVKLKIGDGILEVEARDIQTLLIDSVEREIWNGQVWVKATVTLRNGVQYPDSRSTDTLKQVYIAAEGMIQGVQGRNRVYLDMAYLQSFSLQGLEEKPDSVAEKVDSTKADSTKVDSLKTNSSKPDSLKTDSTQKATVKTDTTKVTPTK